MMMDEYQRLSAKTNQVATPSGTAASFPSTAEVIPLLGLTGEVGALLSEYKKFLRDGPGNSLFPSRLAEELGDVLWYVAAVASHFGLSLDEIAAGNLRKTRERWTMRSAAEPLDREFPANERLPRTFKYRFGYDKRANGTEGVALFDSRGRRIGDLLTDNSHEDDGYRFHDVMHFALVAVLGWSPVARKLLKRKRKSMAIMDEVEDGARAAVIDEAIVAMVFDYVGHDLDRAADLRRIDSETLRAIRALTRGFEVQVRTEAEWERAIVLGLNVWGQVERHNGGAIIGDFRKRSFTYAQP